MTTGRINQVTVLHARARSPHEAAGTRAHTLSPGQSWSPTDQSRPSFARATGPLALSDDPPRSSTNRVPSPPISHASETLPPVLQTGGGPFGEDYRRAAAQRAARTRRISDRLVADRIGPRAIKSTSLVIARIGVKGTLHGSHSRL
jgi:hypothetical protein